MADGEYKVLLGVELNQGDLNNIKQTIEKLGANGINIDVNFKNVDKNLLSIAKQMQQSGVSAGNAFSVGVNKGISNNANILDNFKKSLKNVGMTSNDIDRVAQRIESLGVRIETLNQKTMKINGKNGKTVLSVDVSGIDELGNAVRITQEYDTANGNLIKTINNVATVQQRAGASSNNFAKQQKQAVANLTNQINQMNRAANDMNAARPIKDKKHINDLSIEYSKITAAIQRMGSASSDAFEDERIKVKELISKFKSLVAEYRNAESVATSLRTRDIDTVKSTYESKLDVLISKMNSSGVYDGKLKQDAENLRTTLNSATDASGLTTFLNGLDKLDASYRKAAESARAFNQAQKVGINASGLQSKIQDLQRVSPQIEEFKTQINGAEVSVSSLLDELSKVKTQGDFSVVNAKFRAFTEAAKAAGYAVKDVDAGMADMEKVNLKKQELSLKMSNWLKENSKATRAFGGEIQNLQNKLANCGNMRDIDNIATSFNNVKLRAKEAGVATQTFGDKFKKQFAKYRDYLSVATIFMYTTMAIKDMFNQVVAVDTAMTELKKVTDETSESYDAFLVSAAKRSKEIGTTIDGLISSTADFARLGYGFEESQGLAEVANIYKVVGDEIDSVETATQSLISTLAAFKEQAGGLSDDEFAMEIVDKFNEVSNNFAISSGGIGDALTRSASSLAAANNTLDESIALITAANTVVQDPDAVGTAFKTISMRIRGAKSELEDAGLETDGMVESTAKLREELLALSGVDIMLNENEFKSTYAIMDELAKKWSSLTDIQQASVTELIAGKRQGNIVSSLMANFDVARDALETSLNSSGSAIKEHEKWQQSLEARLNKLKAAWQSLSQTFLSSDFLKVVLDGVIALVSGLDNLLQTLGTFPTLLGVFTGGKIIGSFFKTLNTINFVGDIKSLKGIISILSLMFPNAAAGVDMFVTALSGGVKVAGLLKVALSGLWTVIAAHPILAIVSAVGLAIVAFDKFTESASELSERMDNVTSEYKEQKSKLVDNQSSFDAEAKRYEKLSKGVGELGENVSLTADEYEEYRSLVNSIAEQVPSMVSGYNAQGDAILNCADSVGVLADAYRNLIREQNQVVLDNGEDYFEDFANDYNFAAQANTENINMVKSLMEMTGDELDAALNNSAYAERVSNFLNANGFKRENFGTEGYAKHVKRVINSEQKEVRTVLEEASADIESYSENLGVVTEAYFSNAFLGKYSNMNEEMQSAITNFTSGLDSAFYGEFLNKENSYEELTKFYDNILETFNGLSDEQSKNFEAAFNLKTQFNGGEISYGEYVNGIKDAGKLVDGIDFSEDIEIDQKIKSQIKLSLGLDENDSIKGYQTLLERLTSEKHGIQMSESMAEAFLNGLSASELSVAMKLMASEEVDLSNFDADSLRKYIQEQARINDALVFNADIEVDKASIETFNVALEESASAMGMANESISALEAKYKSLEGYDSSVLFEKTTNGIKVNRDELAKLEKEHNNLKKSEVKKHLKTLVDKYNDVTKEIENCTSASERAILISEREKYGSRIEELSRYQSQLEGVTGAYQRWLDAQETPEAYEGYQAAAAAYKDVGDELKRGIMGNASKKYIDLLSGQDLDGASFDEYYAAWKKLDDKVTDAGYSVKDFFTVDDDGNITDTGVDRFFESLQKEFKGSVAKFDEETESWTYDFGADSLEAIQNKWGIGIEAIQLILEAASTAGYNVDWGGILDNLDLDKTDSEELMSLAKSIQESYNSLKDVEDISLHFDSEDLSIVESDIDSIKKKLSEFINEDETVNLEAEGAEELQAMLSILITKKQQLSVPAIIKVDTSQIDSAKTDVIEVINAAQELQIAFEDYEFAISTGIDVETARQKLNDAITSLKGTDAEIRAELKLPTNAELRNAAKDLGNVKVGASLDDTAIGTIESKIQTECTPEIIAKVTGLDETAIQNGDGGRKVVYKPEHSEVDAYVNGLTDINKSIIYTYETEGNEPKPKNITRTITYKYNTPLFGEAIGTAHSKGTVSGKAFAHGSWGIGENGVALGGELGRELVVRDGKFFTIGDNGAEFFKHKKNDIIFNAAQTESLLKYGGIKGANPRGKIYGSGSAFASGSTSSVGGRSFASGSNSILKAVNNAINKTVDKFINSYYRNNIDTTNNSSKSSSNNSNKNISQNSIAIATADATERAEIAAAKAAYSAKVGDSNFANDKNKTSTGSGSGSGGGSSSKDEFKEKIDWIETAIDRIERAIDSLDKKSNSVYESWTNRNIALVDQISKVKEEIELQERAYDRYLQEANSVGLDEAYASKVRDGTIDIETITDEALKDKIDEYQQWYEKALDCKDAVEELKETEAELYAQRVEHAASQYEGILGVIEHEKSVLEEYINQSEAQAWIVSKEYYDALANNERENIAELQNQKAAMLAEFNAAMNSGTIAEGSEAYYDMVSSIDEVTMSITESQTALLEYEQTIQQLSWETFDMLQEKISSVVEETEFLIDLMGNDKLHDDTGKLTGEGKATMGLHGVAYNTYMAQADQAAAEAARLKKELEADPFDTELEERYREMVAIQQEYILSAEDEKDAIRDLVEEGINLEIEALEERIDKYNEALESQKDLYNYQKKVAESTKEIASLEKQMAAYAEDDSEEARQKIQQIKVDLENARADLEETEYDKYISDTEQLLDNLVLEYSELLNMRLDNIDALIADMIQEINSDAGVIGETIREATDSVGYTLSESMNTIWDKSTVDTKNVITTYGEKFSTAQTTTNNALNTINNNLQNIINKLNGKAQTSVSTATTSSVAKSSSSASAAANTSANNVSGGNGTPKIGDKVKFVSGQYYYDSEGKNPIGSKNQGKEVYITNINNRANATHPYHISTGKKLGDGDLGWLKLNQISGYATGKKNFFDDEIAWTQENGTEFIVRPSDGAILTPIARGDKVLNAKASGNIWQMANSPAEFIRDNLNLGVSDVPNGSNVQNSYTQYLDKVVFNLPEVKNYEELLYAFQKDKNFERLIHAMTIDRVAGKSSLAKGKSIR